jgi:hypothetical protein
LEDAQDHTCFAGLDGHLVAVGPRPPLLVHAHGPDGNRLVPERALPNDEAAFLLADLAAQRLLLEIAQLKLVEDAADLDPEVGLLVVGVQAVGDGYDAHAVEAQLGQDRQHEVVVAREA